MCPGGRCDVRRSKCHPKIGGYRENQRFFDEHGDLAQIRVVVKCLRCTMVNAALERRRIVCRRESKLSSPTSSPQVKKSPKLSTLIVPPAGLEEIVCV